MPKNVETKHWMRNPSEDWKYYKLPNQGLRSYFGIVQDGQPDIYYGNLANVKTKKDVQRVLSEWSKILESISDKWPTLWEYENDLRAKVGPMSHMFAYRYRVKDVEEYYSSILSEQTPILDRAIAATLKEWSQVRGLRVRGQDRTVAKMRLSTNSGNPYFTKRRNVLDKTLPVQVKHYDGVTHLEQAGMQWLATAILGWRGQEGGPNYNDTKQRVVWMFPFGVNVAELQVYQPLIEAAQKFNLVPAWVSMEQVDLTVTKLFDSKGKDDQIICTDFTAFDQHFNSSLQECALLLLRNILTNNKASTEWLENVFPVKYDIPMNAQPGIYFKGNHGMASGSGGTNADETLAHRALQYEAAMRQGQQLNPNSQCLGDDGILSYPGATVEDVTRAYTAHGLDMNLTKQYASAQDCTYLRRWHHTDYRVDGVCVGVYSTFRALGRLMYHERYYDPEVWSGKMVALRQLSIVENVKWHPLRDQFAEFCMARDKFRLGLDIPGFLDNIEKEASEAIELMPDFLGYTKTQMKSELGIKDWWIVKYLKSK